MPFKGSCALFPELQRDKDTVQVYPARHRTPPLRITDANLDCAFVENSLLSIDSKIGEGRPPPLQHTLEVNSRGVFFYLDHRLQQRGPRGNDRQPASVKAFFCDDGDYAADLLRQTPVFRETQQHLKRCSLVSIYVVVHSNWTISVIFM